MLKTTFRPRYSINSAKKTDDSMKALRKIITSLNRLHCMLHKTPLNSHHLMTHLLGYQPIARNECEPPLIFSRKQQSILGGKFQRSLVKLQAASNADWAFTRAIGGVTVGRTVAPCKHVSCAEDCPYVSTRLVISARQKIYISIIKV